MNTFRSFYVFALAAMILLLTGCGENKKIDVINDFPLLATGKSIPEKPKKIPIEAKVAAIFGLPGLYLGRQRPKS